MAEIESVVSTVFEEPTAAFSDDGVDLTLIQWMLSLTPSERLDAAQSMVDLALAARDPRSAIEGAD